jgi:hypothetical protein
MWSLPQPNDGNILLVSAPSREADPLRWIKVAASPD